MTNLKNSVEPPKINIVDTLPVLGNAENGEMFLLTSDKKIYVRVTEGWLSTPALT